MGNISLATIFWPLYIINEQEGKTVHDVWDGENLMLTFRRNVSARDMNLWYELHNLMDSISLTEEEDNILWNYTSTGKYSVQSLYAVVNHRGVIPMFVSSVWKLIIPPRVQFFLWLLSKNRALTRDNLAKRRPVNDPSYLFCIENESIMHLFFDCFVAKYVCGVISEFLNQVIGGDFESIARFWVAHKRHILTNAITSAVTWLLWKLRNEMCFQGVTWTSMKKVLMRIARMIRRWGPLYTVDVQLQVEECARRLEERASSPPQLQWTSEVTNVIRVGSIGCSAFGHGFFGSA